MSTFDDDEALFEDIYEDDTEQKAKTPTSENDETKKTTKDTSANTNSLSASEAVAQTSVGDETSETRPEEAANDPLKENPKENDSTSNTQSADSQDIATRDQLFGNEYANHGNDQTSNPGAQGSHSSASYDNPPPQFRPSNLGRDSGKMFIGGLNWDTTEEGMIAYFSKYGEISDLTIMKDSSTGRSRGFGFLTFKDPRSVDEVIKKDHILDGKLIDPKRAIAREEQDKIGKIFVGGIDPLVNEKDFSDFFSQFGRIVDAQLMIDKDSGRSRGFGFITFDTPEAVDRCCVNKYLTLKGKSMEVKRAEPRGQHQHNQNQQQQQQQMQNQYAPYANAYGQMQMNSGMPTFLGATPEMMQEYWQRMQWYMYQQQQQQQQQQQDQNGKPGQNYGSNDQDEEEPLNPQQQMSRDDYDSRSLGARFSPAPSGPSGRSYDRDNGYRGDYRRGKSNDRDERNLVFPKGPRGSGGPPSGPSGQGVPPSGPSGQKGFKRERYHPYGRKPRR